MRKTVVSVLVLSLFIGSTLTVGFGLQIISSALSIDNVSTLAIADGTENNHLPKSILVYTQFADANPGGELEHTLAVVNDKFQNDYQIVNLTDFNELPSIIMDYDVLLIPEQEIVYDQNITDVAAAWGGALSQFVTNGGNLVVLDCFSFLATYNYGPTLQILNRTGIITYTEGYAYGGGVLNRIAPNDALAINVPNTFTGTDGTLRFNGTGGTVVVDDGIGPVVVHKTMGKGHIALLGFDLYTPTPKYETILVNAIQLTRHVVFDQSHSPLKVISGGFLNYTLDLVSQGFAVSAMSTWNPATIEMADVLILSACGITYSSAEVDVIEDFVLSGGGLFVLTDWGTFGNALDPITNRFGFVRNTTGYIEDTDDVLASYSAYNVSNFESHSIMLTVNNLELDRGGVLLSIPDNAIALVTTDNDGTTTYDDGTPAEGLVVAAAAGIGLGRVAVVTDHDFVNPITDPDSDAITTYYDADNDIFLLNSILWASGAGSEEQIVLFDESHGRNWWITASYLGFAAFLTENGYTVRWMYEWNSAMVDTADALIIQDGSLNYTAPEVAEIVDYVSSGGGLCLLGGQTSYGLQADFVGNEFGLDLNNTGYITDTDDWLDASHQNIMYNASNFGNHPIMNGVTRLELEWTSAFISIGAGTSLVRTDTDGTAQWNDGSPANGLTLMTAVPYNKGRVFFSADYIFPRYNYDYDLDGIPILYDSDNDLLLQNVFRWLTENRAPMVEVEAPNGGEVLSGMVLVNWTAIDFDSDLMTFSVYYSDNNGTDWTMLATGLTGLQYEWNTTMYDDGNGYMIRVMVSDGALGTMDESDNPFELDNFAAPFGGLPIDPAILAVIIGAALVIIIVVVLIMKKRGGGK